MKMPWTKRTKPETSRTETVREVLAFLYANKDDLGLGEFSKADMELALEDKGWMNARDAKASTAQAEAQWVYAHQEALGLRKVSHGKNGEAISEAFTQADIELALDDRGWLVGGKRMAGELDPLSRQVQVNKSRYYWLRDPLAKQAVRLWTDYTLGDQAMTYECDDKVVQKQLDQFMKDRRNIRMTSRAGQRRLNNRLMVDGELFFTFYKDGTMRMIDCLQITDIITDPDDEDTVVAYKRVTSGAFGTSPKTLYYAPWDGENESDQDGGTDSTSLDVISPQGYNPNATAGPNDDGGNPNGPGFQTPGVDGAMDPMTKTVIKFEPDCVMYHLAFDAFEKRGSSLFGCCSDWSREHRRFMICRVAIVQSLSKFAQTITMKGGQQMMNKMQGLIQSTYAQTGLDGGVEHQPATAPGGMFLQNDGLKMEAMPRATGAGDATQDGNQLKLMVSAGTGIMLHYFGDPSTGNLATATAMELPMLKMFSAHQVFWEEAWRDMFSIVLGEQNGKEPADITISLPDILDEDIQKLAIYIQNLTGVFPEAKVPAVLKRCLVSLNVDNIDEVMDEIAAQKELNDQQQAANQKAQLANNLAVAKAHGPQTAKPGSDAPPDGGAAGTNQDTTEAVRMERLTAALLKLSEAVAR